MVATLNTAKVVLQKEESVDADALCEQLREQSRRATGDSSAVDRLEWKAARVIEALLRERNGIDR